MTVAIMIPPLTIPVFKSTEEAVAWGSTIPFFAVPFVQAAMRMLDSDIRLAKERGQLQRQVDLATRRQLLRESIEARVAPGGEVKIGLGEIE